MFLLFTCTHLFCGYHSFQMAEDLRTLQTQTTHLDRKAKGTI